MAKKQAVSDSFKVQIAGAAALVQLVEEGARVTVHEATEAQAVELSRIAWEGRPLFPSSQFHGRRSITVAPVFGSEEGGELYFVSFDARVPRAM